MNQWVLPATQTVLAEKLNKMARFLGYQFIISTHSLTAYAKREEQGLAVFNVNMQTEIEIKDELIIAIFIRNIEEVVKEYYIHN